MSDILITLMVGFLIFVAIFFIFSLREKRRLSSSFVQDLPMAPKVKAKAISIPEPLMKLISPIINMPYLKNLQAQTEILKISLNLPIFVSGKVLLAVFATGVSMFIPGLPFYTPAVTLVAAFFIPDILIMGKVRAKKEEITRVFPETIDLLDLCISAGLDFPSSIKWVIEKSDPNAFLEQLAIVLHEIQVGRNRTDALKDMGKRLQIADVNSFVRTVVQSERMGTSVEEAFRNLSEDTRNTRFQSGERYAIKASLKILFPLLFCILPVILIVVAGPIIIKFTQGELIPSGQMWM